jgi:hypothetical protein
MKQATGHDPGAAAEQKQQRRYHDKIQRRERERYPAPCRGVAKMGIEK